MWSSGPKAAPSSPPDPPFTVHHEGKTHRVAQGNNVMHFINGHLMSTSVDLDTAKAPTQGILALQIHVGPPMEVQFKDLKLFPLEAKP